MLLQHSIKPISYVKAHAADIIRDIADSRATIIITQNGEAKAVLQGIAEYEHTQESLALLKILAVSRKDIEAGLVQPVDAAFASLKERIIRRRQS